MGGSYAASSFCGLPFLEAGWDGTEALRPLLQFNVAAALPAQVTVLNAALHLYLTGEANSSMTQLAAYGLTRPWTTAASWNTADGVQPWTTPGGDSTATDASRPVSLGGTLNTWVTLSPTQLVADWLSGVQPNLGLLLKEPLENQQNSFAFASAEAASNPPTLTVTYAPWQGARAVAPSLAFGLDDRLGVQVNLASGNLLAQASDLAIAGTGLPLRLERSYNSLSAAVTTPEGNGWLLDTGRDVGLTPFGDGSVGFVGPSGYQAPFLRQADAGGAVLYHYNAGDQLDYLTEPGNLGQTTFAYDQNGERTSTTFSGGVVQSQSYDASGRLATIAAKTAGGTQRTRFSYSYTKPGGGDGMLVSGITDSVDITTTAQQYDDANRLTSWVVTPGSGSTFPALNYQYTFDGDGNRTSINANGTTTTLGYNAANEWMTATSGGKTANYSYDANGNELGNDGFGDPSKALKITYNAKNQAAIVTDTQQNVIPMTYTGPGQAERVSAGWVASNPDTPGGSATYTHGSGLLNATDNAGTAYYTRDPGGTLISQRLPNGVVYYYLLDGQGSVVRLVDPSGNVVATYHYCPTGNAAVPDTGPATASNPWRHWGGFYEPGTETYVFGNLRVDSNSGNALSRANAILNLTASDIDQLLRFTKPAFKAYVDFAAELVYAVYYYDYQDLMHFAAYYPSFVVSDLVHEQDAFLSEDIQLDIFKNRVFQNGELPNDEGIYGKFVEREFPGYANFPAVYLPGFRLQDRGIDRYDANGQYPWEYGWLTG